MELLLFLAFCGWAVKLVENEVENPCGLKDNKKKWYE